MFGRSAGNHDSNGHAGGDHGILTDVALLGLRLTAGGLLAGHGAQKLFGSFGGHGLQGTAGWLESIGMKPGKSWAMLAGASEFGGGLLTAAGLMGPVGPVTTVGAMGIATGKVHWGKPIWVTSGGAEFPVTNIAIASGLALTGPGRFSLDRLFGVRMPWYLVMLTVAGTAAGVALGIKSPAPAEAQPEQKQDDSTPAAAPKPTADSGRPAASEAAEQRSNGTAPQESRAGSH